MDARVGGVDHDRDFDLANQLVVEGRNVLDFVAVGALQANVNDMRAAFHLAAGDFGGFLPLLRGHEFFEFARADHVRALADDQRPRAFFGLDDLDSGVDGAMARLGGAARALSLPPSARLRGCARSVVPQQPPTMLSQPRSTKRSSCSASDVGVSG